MPVGLGEVAKLEAGLVSGPGDMSWKPIHERELDALVASELSDCSEELRQFFARVRVPAHKWQLSPWGDEGDGFWVLAVHRDRVLWYNDIEEGFNVSTFEVRGQIPGDEYWCNQDPLCLALSQLTSDPGSQLRSASG